MSLENSLSPTQRFWNMLKPDWSEIRNVYIYSLFSGVVNLSLPLGIQAIVNLIQGGRMSTSWIILVMCVVLGVAANGVLQIFQLRITENLQQKIFSRAAFEFAYRIPRIRLDAMFKHYAPELMNRFFDIIAVQKGLSKLLIEFSAAGLQVLFGLLLLSLYHPFFMLFSVIMVFLVYFIFQFTGRIGLKTSLKESKHKYEVAHWLEELARTSLTIKLAGRTDMPLNRVNAHVGDYIGARESHFKTLLKQYWLMVAFKVIVASGLLILGGVLVMEQSMNIGQFVAAEIIILLVMTSVEKLILSLETIYDILTGIEKLGQVTDMPLEHEDGVDAIEQIKTEGMEVTLENVDFTFPGQKNKTLNALSLQINEGDKVMVTGQNVSGRSTLLQVLAGLYEIQEGGITYNQLPVDNIEMASLRSIIGDCLSQERLFHGSLYDNITMGRPRATLENVQWVVHEFGLEHYIRSLPKGFDTILGPQGEHLPRSIVQKLMLARSVVDRPKLLLLEDVFEHLGEEDNRKIMDFVTNPENKWTLVAVSNDPYLAQKCNRVIIMEQGQVTHDGDYESLKTVAKFNTNGHA